MIDYGYAFRDKPEFNKFNYIFIVIILLIFRKSRIFLKILTLANFFVTTLILWHAQINNILIGKNVLINYGFISSDLNIINVLFLITIEIIYYLWSFLSHNNNLSNWSVPAPFKDDIVDIIKILIFYIFIIAYYS